RFRIQLLHDLTMKMNTAYLSMTGLDEILQAILVGITAEEGLQFNRAFLAMFDDAGKVLEGRMAIGPGCREEAGHIWKNMREQDLHFNDIITSIKDHCFTSDTEVNRIVQAFRVDSGESDHLLIRAARERRSVNVVNGRSDYSVPPELLGLLQEESFVVVPLFSPSRSLGVIIADHFVTGEPVTEDLIEALESFASQASLAIEHCHLYMAMEHKIRELETMTHELEKNKDLLVEAERYSAVGHMSAHLAHKIRNPITSIGGTARLLARKTDDPEWLKFLNMMTSEAEKIETTLEDMFNFVEQVKSEKERVSLYPLIHKSVMLYYNTMQKQGVEYDLIFPETEPVLEIDPRLMHQVFVHLIRNSIEAMPDGGELSVEVRQEKERIEIVIRDTGIGIADPNLERATEPFYTTKTFGTGMGLTLVKRIVSDHGGLLKIQRRKQGGTRVTVTLQLPVNSETM
ncbi:MAG: GAF domain-containing protein, partial [Desulfobulbaceae bacterium]|nr:GAF domain-containing protein [Desulfobulbaceae bacterium]